MQRNYVDDLVLVAGGSNKEEIGNLGRVISNDDVMVGSCHLEVLMNDSGNTITLDEYCVINMHSSSAITEIDYILKNIEEKRVFMKRKIRTIESDIINDENLELSLRSVRAGLIPKK